jgi:hypothetical protein
MRHWDSIDPEQLVSRTIEAPISRRQMLRRGAIATGAVAGLSLLDVAPALAATGRQPRPIPGGFDANFNPVPTNPFIHVLPPAYGFEMSTITDFHGEVVAGEVQGTAHGSNGATHTFDCDMRFMRGEYVGRDGRRRNGTFGFI